MRGRPALQRLHYSGRSRGHKALLRTRPLAKCPRPQALQQSTGASARSGPARGGRSGVGG
eukprot:12904693-Prorocentrum_lima.AAC.1